MQIALDNVSYLEELYEQYHKHKGKVTEEWRQYFDYISKKECIVQKKENIKKQMIVLQLINAYRYMGHIKANINPINPGKNKVALQLSLYELNKEDINKVFYTGVGKNKATLKEIIEVLDITYCRSIGCEFMHLINNEEKVWLEQSLESVRNNYSQTKKISLHILELITAAEGLENYLSSKYPGTKRFGIEGGETLIPMLYELIQRSGNYSIKEIFMGMAHRGRINVLVNILGKSPADIIKEFEGKQIYESGSGDVKYHQGFSSKIMTKGGGVHLKLAFNPSHLEIIYPVIEGAVRARQDYINDMTKVTKVLPIVIHGDTAFSGQGVVMETLQMSKIKEYNTGGTLHIIINNQIGFTTYRHNARSTKYCSDIAKMFQYPVLHVNGDDPEAVQYVTQLAVDYRNKFKKDVVIDMICYRRRGHHESDEPSITQPIMYKKIKNHPTTREIYSKYLLKQGLISKKEVKNMVYLYRHNLDYDANNSYKKSSVIMYKYYDSYDEYTSFEMKRMHSLAGKMCHLGLGIEVEVQSTVAKIYEDRRMVSSNINWGFAEMLSYATLLDEGYAIRITGQDTGRGTFSHRHAVIHNQKDGSVWIPMQHIKKGQPKFTIVDSILSEEAVLAFEYGYSTTSQNMFVAWEAQFGDFANGAQVVIDQFISSGETKWGSLCGLTLLLPHGYEGQGPEHSSARIERFIQLCAEQNMQLCIPTNPSQLFHLIRSHVRRKLRKPLILMQPKSLLRHKYAKSSLEDLSYGSFKTVIGETENIDPDIVKRIIITSGKVYYDLFAYRKANNIKDTAILRIEQLYPFPEKSIIENLSSYSKCEHIIWCQEEPKNQGAWYQIKYYLNKKLKLKFIGRTAAAAPASGYIDVHMKQQANLIKEAFL
ncbi:2-oxoglutarate dehydrogenase E1 component [Candidatus Portiera aleyrodidarum]|uniref:oxoglutarate dehydrogenase (succinyl-transferring) n=1 Tax=Candidatus Portiera aleyrodidarum TV TaxID=1297582 RepID=A0A8D4BPQ1_9GAMM|nr:2-oxoglutarate dehydrogenase E1 component [Candidatus Portiera aleyrodidarum]AGI27075.1 2-oxoglutarate dehydrogenase, E1 component [Candidatus Portiera aleyrodidarum TV]CEI59038.1 2-oxoglutarate dehydrogenase E1 component [Candidatus Portiera aleyrodidarum]